MSKQYFASFEPFEIFENFNGVEGTYIKSFLISDVINLNKWQATHEANIANLDSFIGRPGIHYINPENGKRDHTSATSFEKSLQLQELYRAASIIAVGSDLPTKKNWQVSKMTDENVTKMIKSGEIKWISPSIWPDENAVEIIDSTDGEKVDRVHGYTGLHYAFVDEPAYGIEAEIKSFCDGTTKQCQVELQQFEASIRGIDPITDKKILLVNTNTDMDSSKDDVNTSDKTNIAKSDLMATEEELRKEVEDAKKALKATQEELEKLKDESAKKATEEENQEEKKTEGKKATDGEDDEEKKALKARIESLEKVPIVDKIVSGQLSAGVITEDKVPDVTTQLMAASKLELDAVLNTQKSFEAKLNSTTSQGHGSIPYMGSYSEDSSSYDASSKTSEELLMEASG